MSRTVCWLLVGLLLGLYATGTIVLLKQRSDAGLDMPAYSVYSERADGLAEAGLLLRRLGWAPVAVTRPIQHTHHRGLLLLVEPGTSQVLSDADGGIPLNEARALLHWVEKGNTLLLASRHTTTVHQALHVTVQDAESSGDAFSRVELAEGGAYTEGIQHLSTASASILQCRDGLPLWSVGDRPAAVLLRRGEGRILVLADPSPLTRIGLVRSDGEPREDNALFLANVAALESQDGEVYFDEYYHGLHAATGFWPYLCFYHVQMLFVPLLLVLLVGAWAAGVRLGPAAPRPRPLQADAVAYASALARLYERAGANRLLARTLVPGFLDSLTRHLALPRQAVPAQILAGWNRQHPASPSGQHLEKLLRKVSDLRKGRISARQLLEATRSFEAFLHEQEMAPRTSRRPVHAS